MKRNIRQQLIITGLLKQSTDKDPQITYGPNAEQAYAAHPWIKGNKKITDIFGPDYPRRNAPDFVKSIAEIDVIVRPVESNDPEPDTTSEL